MKSLTDFSRLSVDDSGTRSDCRSRTVSCIALFWAVTAMKLWMFLLLLWSSAGGQDQTTSPVTCVVMETCVLPCSFTPGDGVVIQWHKERESPSEQDYLVHVYAPGYSTSEQDAPFRGRTSLFPEEFSRGNASVSLTEVRVKDQGKYLCQPYTTEHDWAEEWIKLSVKAPGTALNMEQKGDRLVCSSEDIYPQPNVSWTPDVRPQTLVKETQNQLHSISSSLTFDPLQQYTCNISTHHSWKSATYSVHTPMEMSRNATIPCTTSVSPVKRLVWTFNYIEPIVTVSGADVDYAAPWRKFVKGVSEWGSLSLQELGSEQEGVYLCELHTDSHTHFSRTELRVHQDAGPNIGVIVGSVVGVALCVTFIIIFIMWKHKKETKSDPPEAEALLPLLPLDPREYSCEFSLDPNTAHRKLKLSEDNRTVTCVKEDQEEKFKNWPQVLSSTGLRGRCYWEVEWKGEGVSIAVSYKGIRRRGTEEEYVFGWNDQSWSLWTNGKQYFALHKHNQIKVGVVSGDWSLRSGRVGVFLDSEAGTLTFYKTYIDAKPSPLHTFYSSFTEPLFPGFELDPDSFVTVMDLKTAVKHPIIQEPKKYSCEFSLDPNTTHRKLKLSEDNRTVSYEEEEQEYEEHEDRFTGWKQVLSSTGLRGRCYWEVEWEGEGVSIAVSYKGIKRRGKGDESLFGLNDQSWSLIMFGCCFFASHNKNKTVAYDFSPSQNTNRRSNTTTGESSVSSSRVGVSSIRVGVSSIRVGVSSIRVGVFLDSEAGTLTFYKICSDGENFPLHTFYSSFTEPLFPGFGLLPDSSVTVMDLKLSQAE